MHFKKISMLLFVCILSLFTVHNQASANVQFEDVPKQHGAYNEINFLVGKNVVSGYMENGKKYFKPNNNVTRGQAAKMLVKATNNKGLSVKTSSFDDITTNLEVSLYAERGFSEGWFQYTSGRKFSPNMIVTRQEMAKIISEAYNLNIEQYANLELPFKDVAKTSTYYKYIAAVYYNGIAQGNSTTTFNPKGGVTRSQFALFVARATSSTYRLDLPIQGISVPSSAKALGEVEITTNGLNVRSTPDFTSTANNKLGTANKGEKYKYYEATSTYYKIGFKGEYAYVYKSYAKLVTADKPVTTTPVEDKPSTTTSITGIATVNDLSVREKADGSSKRVGVISRGTKLPVHSITGNWAKVTYNGATAYVHKTYLRLKNNSGSAVKGRIIVLDAGHGGKDPGAVGASVNEKTVVLNVTKKLKALLEAKGAIVYMTRAGDTYPELSDRVQYARNKNGEMFISIHANSGPASATGAETFVSATNNPNALEDQALAKLINDEIVKNADMRDRGVKSADYYVIKNLVMPAVLVELGFISNSSDHAKLASDKYQTIYAESIYNGIMKYYQR